MRVEGQIFLFRFDISNPLPVREPFDFVICRASIHHTSSPTRTFDSLVRGVAPGGRLAISAYAQKGRLRELNDDALRALVTPMSNERALQVAAEFTALGKVLQGVAQKVTVERDLEWLWYSGRRIRRTGIGLRSHRQVLAQRKIRRRTIEHRQF